MLQTMLRKSGGNDGSGGFTLDGDYVHPVSGDAVTGGVSDGACDNVGASGANMLTTDASSDKKKGFTMDGDYVDLEQGEEPEKARYIGIRGLDGSM